jgi:hypothetical protein
MSTSDGQVGALHKLVDHGPNAQRYNIVILGDGYQAAELGKFATDADTFVARLQATDPFGALWPGINVFRLDVTSKDSGADDPKSCGDGSAGTGAKARTYFDATFCGGGQIRRLLTCNADRAASTARAKVPQVLMTMVIVNSAEYGGSGGKVAVFSTHPSSVEIGLHEMGHTAFGLADEYESYFACSPTEVGHDHYGFGEPAEPNVTARLANIKWRASLSEPLAALPTTANANPSRCDPQPSPKPDGYVGAFDGARYFHSGCYRPAFDCRMRSLGKPFCGVCQQAIIDTLKPFMP